MKRIALAALLGVALTVNAVATDAQLLEYATEIHACYDVDGDGKLNITETAWLVQGTLYGTPCPTTPAMEPQSTVDESFLTTPAHLEQLQSFFGDRVFNLTRLYVSTGNICNSDAWHTAVDNLDNVITIAMTTSGKFIGGFHSTSCPSVSTSEGGEWVADSEAFIFSLTEDAQFTIQSDMSDRATFCYGTSRSHYLQSWKDTLFFSMNDNQQCVGLYIQG